jgi:hypothetical protein
MAKRKASSGRPCSQQRLPKTHTASQIASTVPRMNHQAALPSTTSPLIESLPPIQPHCMEHFHNPLCDIAEVRPCESKLHEIHYVCFGCIRTSWNIEMIGYRNNSIIEKGAVASLCKPCTTEVIRSYGTEFDSCVCPSIKEPKHRSWFCMDCLHTIVWRAGLAKTEYDLFAYGANADWVPNDNRGICQFGHTLCPRCQSNFRKKTKRTVASACLGCHGLVIHAANRKQKPTQTLSPFRLPVWTARVVGHERAPMEENIAPDCVPVEERTLKGSWNAYEAGKTALDYPAGEYLAATTATKPFRLEWNFPRNSIAHLTPTLTDEHSWHLSTKLRQIRDILKHLSRRQDRYYPRGLESEVQAEEQEETEIPAQYIAAEKMARNGGVGTPGVIEDDSGNEPASSFGQGKHTSHPRSKKRLLTTFLPAHFDKHYSNNVTYINSGSEGEEGQPPAKRRCKEDSRLGNRS